jgi:hypothetical protein
VSDCQAIVSAFLHPFLHEGYRAKFGGLWREKGLAAVHEVRKTPAHRTKEEAIAQGDVTNWFGNDKADHFAKLALAGTGKDGSDYKEARKNHLNSLEEISCKLAGHLDPEAIAMVPRVKTRAKGKANPRSEHQFTRHLGRWACINCGCFKRNLKSRQDRTSCIERSKIQGQIHSSHRIFCGHYEAEEGIPNFSFCVLCGCYASQQNKKLKAKCKSTTLGKETIRTRLGLKQHPITLKPIWKVRRMLLTCDTGPLRDRVNDIVMPGPLDIGPVEGAQGICHMDTSGDDFSMVCDEEEDPFLDFAHS